MNHQQQKHRPCFNSSSSLSYTKKRRRKSFQNHNQQSSILTLSSSTTNTTSLLNENTFKKDNDESINTWSITNNNDDMKNHCEVDINKHINSKMKKNHATTTTTTTIHAMFRKHRPKNNHSTTSTSTVIQQVPSLSLPMMIYQRETSPFWNTSASLNKFKINRVFMNINTKGGKDNNITHCHEKKRKMMKSNRKSVRNNRDSCYFLRSQWNTFIERSLTFNELDTPIADAVLGLDRSGSFLICVGDGRRRGARKIISCTSSSFSNGISISGGGCTGCNDDYQYTHSLLSLRFYGMFGCVSQY